MENLQKELKKIIMINKDDLQCSFNFPDKIGLFTHVLYRKRTKKKHPDMILGLKTGFTALVCYARKNTIK